MAQVSIPGLYQPLDTHRIEHRKADSHGNDPLGYVCWLLGISVLK